MAKFDYQLPSKCLSFICTHGKPWWIQSVTKCNAVMTCVWTQLIVMLYKLKYNQCKSLTCFQIIACDEEKNWKSNKNNRHYPQMGEVHTCHQGAQVVRFIVANVVSNSIAIDKHNYKCIVFVYCLLKTNKLLFFNVSSLKMNL